MPAYKQASWTNCSITTPSHVPPPIGRPDVRGGSGSALGFHTRSLAAPPPPRLSGQNRPGTTSICLVAAADEVASSSKRSSSASAAAAGIVLEGGGDGAGGESSSSWSVQGSRGDPPDPRQQAQGSRRRREALAERCKLLLRLATMSHSAGYDGDERAGAQLHKAPARLSFGSGGANAWIQAPSPDAPPSPPHLPFHFLMSTLNLLPLGGDESYDNHGYDGYDI